MVKNVGNGLENLGSSSFYKENQDTKIYHLEPWNIWAKTKVMNCTLISTGDTTTSKTAKSEEKKEEFR